MRAAYLGSRNTDGLGQSPYVWSRSLIPEVWLRARMRTHVLARYREIWGHSRDNVLLLCRLKTNHIIGIGYEGSNAADEWDLENEHPAGDFCCDWKLTYYDTVRLELKYVSTIRDHLTKPFCRKRASSGSITSTVVLWRSDSLPSKLTESDMI